MKKTHIKRAIDKLFEQCPVDTEKIIQLTVTKLNTDQDDTDTDTYMQVEFVTAGTDYMYDKPKYGSVTFNVSR